VTEKMTSKQRTTIHFTGFGGQGIILSSVIFGTTAVLKGGYNAVQTSSYGSEARGGQCQAELILSKEEILSPSSENIDILISMSQQALNTYIGRLSPGKVLIIDPGLVTVPNRDDITIYELPATAIATELGLRIAANMVVMGFLQQGSGLITSEDLFDVISEHVPSKFLSTNLLAARRGIELAIDMNAKLGR